MLGIEGALEAPNDGDMSVMKCLILGGGGFLGSHLCDALLREGHSVRIFDRPNLYRFREFGPDEQIKWVEGDLSNPEHLSPALDGCDVVYHLVSTTIPKDSNDNPTYDIESNVVPSLHFLNLARDHKVKKIIFTSSGGTVYGVPQHMPIPESHATNPLSSYGIGKLVVEKYLHLYSQLHGLDYCVLRLSNPYGERQRSNSPQGVIAVFLNLAMQGRAVQIWGDGSVVRDYIHVSDVASAMLKALSFDATQKIFNIGSGQGLSLNEVLEEMELLLGAKIERNYQAGRKFDAPANILDISRARTMLDWAPKVSFHEGLRRTYQWMQQNDSSLR